MELFCVPQIALKLNAVNSLSVLFFFGNKFLTLTIYKMIFEVPFVCVISSRIRKNQFA